jgi:glycosyltransferase involved in cell wall biosynthesis
MNWIFITAYKRFEELKACVESIDKYAPKDNLTIHLTLNSGPDQVAEIAELDKAMANFKRTCYFHVCPNAGKVAAMNDAAK